MPESLTQVDMKILDVLVGLEDDHGDRGCMCGADIAQLVGIPGGSVGSRLVSLAKRGLVARVRSGRILVWEATDAGVQKAMQPDVSAAMDRVWDRALGMTDGCACVVSVPAEDCTPDGSGYLPAEDGWRPCPQSLCERPDHHHTTQEVVRHMCEKCGRLVRSTHGDCGGDPRATCAVYGCGDDAVEVRLEETHGDGRRANLSYCARHL